jgi:hypothetical protein
LDYSVNDIYSFLTKNAIVISLPVTSQYEYGSDCKLTAIKNPVLPDGFINQIKLKTHVMFVRDEKKMIFLIADDCHLECFSSTIDFYNNYFQLLCDQKLIDLA